MERITYRKTLDTHKNGIQFTLQGFETADKASRRIEISLMASGDTIDLPLEQLAAVMYVTTPNATEPSINECTIKDNTVIYDVLPIVEEGITEMQLKLIETRVDGANGVLASPRFAVEVSKSNAEDESVTQTTTYTALENAIATAKSVYDERLLRIELDSNCMFRAYYADGSVYESDVLKELFLKGEALLSQSYARGGTGVREGEDTDNSMYYSNVSKSASLEADNVMGTAADMLEEVKKHGVYTAFTINFETGEVEYISPHYSFVINPETGELEAIGEAYTPEENIDAWLNEKTAEINETLAENAEIHSELDASIKNETEMRTLEDTALKSLIQANSDSINNHYVALTDFEGTVSNNFSGVNNSIAANTSAIETNRGNISSNSQRISDNAAEIQAAIAYADEINNRLIKIETIESTEYSGCYYRIVDGETEWINPPMGSGVEYRTTERFRGKPVYIKAVAVGVGMTSSNGALRPLSDTALVTPIEITGCVLVGAVWRSLDYSGLEASFEVEYDDTEDKTYLRVTSTATSINDGYCLCKYTK